MSRTGDWLIRETQYPTDPVAAVAAFTAGDELAWLDGGPPGPEQTAPGRYSLICRRPAAVLEQHATRPATFVVAGEVVRRASSAWRLWRELGRALPRFAPCPLGRAPGWVGYLGYDLADQLEAAMPSAPAGGVGLPRVRMALFASGVVLDHTSRRAYVVAASGLDPDADRTAAESYADWQEGCRAARALATPPAVEACSDVEPRAYQQMVRRALRYIAAGDVYQVNLAQCFHLHGCGDDALALHAAIAAANPAPYSALLRWDAGFVCSASPELFLEQRGSRVLTRPIKGTRPRSGRVETDARQRAELWTSEKEQAELAMIVDLHRNDLGRVCEFGSIRVDHPRRIEVHPTVFHTVADVSGRLRPDGDAFDLIQAAFPAGSITGAPKIRSMQLIRELEPAPRGVYCGAVGALALDGNLTLNVAIRTIQSGPGGTVLHAGGGIVADSDPHAEYLESLAKVRGIVEPLARPPREALPTAAAARQNLAPSRPATIAAATGRGERA
ncbi:MAG: Isochorismate synthase MenF [Phycisphaerae bacterium]|nr:Isochorismate synthase MenF [Phycisphaerae bacterium]